MKAPSNVGVIFDKEVVLKSHSKNSGGKKGFMNDFSQLWGAKGGQSRCLESLFTPFLETFWIMGR